LGASLQRCVLKLYFELAIEAAWSVMAAPPRITIEHVARVAGVSKGAIYARYKSAESLMLAATAQYRRIFVNKLKHSFVSGQYSLDIPEVGMIFVEEILSYKPCLWMLSRSGVIDDIHSILEDALLNDVNFHSINHLERKEICELLMQQWVGIALSFFGTNDTAPNLRDLIISAWERTKRLIDER
jgi:AcrR family transcriptional regulator